MDPYNPHPPGPGDSADSEGLFGPLPAGMGGDFGPSPGFGGPSGPANPGGPYGPLPAGLGGRSGRWRRRRRRRLGCLPLLVLVVIVLVIAYVVPNPWALSIGGRFNLAESWQGLGRVSASNGGQYELFASFKAGLLNGGENGHSDCGTGGCNELNGTAKLCTTSGKTYTFRLSGDVKTWWSTEGAATYLDLTNSPPLQDGWVVAFHGTWHGPDLVLANPDNSFTEAFTKEGVIRTVTSTADAGTAHVTLSYGDPSAFTAACQALAAH